MAVHEYIEALNVMASLKPRITGLKDIKVINTVSKNATAIGKYGSVSKTVGSVTFCKSRSTFSNANKRTRSIAVNTVLSLSLLPSFTNRVFTVSLCEILTYSLPSQPTVLHLPAVGIRGCTFFRRFFSTVEYPMLCASSYSYPSAIARSMSSSDIAIPFFAFFSGFFFFSLVLTAGSSPVWRIESGITDSFSTSASL